MTISSNSPKTNPRLIARWTRVVHAVIVQERDEHKALASLLDFALDAPNMGLNVEAAATAMGMIALAKHMRESCECDAPVDLARARFVAWLTSQDGKRRDVEWPVELVSRCLRGGAGAWPAAFSERVTWGDGEALRRLEDMYQVGTRRALAA